MTRKARLPVLALAGSLLLGACHTGQFPDPNEPDQIASSPATMMANLKDARARLDARVARRQITPRQRDDLMKALTDQYIQLVTPSDATDANAWIVGDLYRDGGRWNEAYRLYSRARKAAKTEDRRINDELRFARAAAVLGRVDEALSAVKSTFRSAPRDKAPILPAALYEVVPAAEGKGRDLELARLLEEAIRQHREAQVEPSSEAGRAFLSARPYHLQRAFSLMIELYDRAGRQDLARDAVRRSDEIMKGYGSA